MTFDVRDLTFERYTDEDTQLRAFRACPPLDASRLSSRTVAMGTTRVRRCRTAGAFNNKIFTKYDEHDKTQDGIFLECHVLKANLVGG